MQCPECHHENPVGAKFCNECATSLHLRCPSCSTENPQNAKFCHQCATPLVGSGPPGAERRQLTVMFCDLAGSTGLASQLDPEDWREVIRAYQTACATIIHRFEGYIAQYLGDGILVYFGYPQAHEDEAQRAVRAGLEILDAMDTLRARVQREWGLPLAVRLGIRTGLVVVGEIGGDGRYEQLALGDTPNIAARIQARAAPGTVVIGDSTHRLVQDHFECRELGPETLRGVAAPMMLYEVMGELETPNRLETDETRPLAPLVGRDAEAGRLAQTWRQVRAGRGHAILLSGEAGVGKTRLVQELKTQVAAERHIWLECRCLPYHQHSALYPLIELLQHLMPLRREDTPEEQLAKIERIASLCRMPMAETVPLFAELLSAEPPPADRYPTQMWTPPQRHKTLQALLALLTQLARQRPLVFIMEGLHHVDPSTLEFLSLLIDSHPPDHVLVLLTYRPDLSPPWSESEHLTAISLSRLKREQVDIMVSQLTAGKALPNALHQHIVSRSDGIPLFVEELTKMVLESDLLREGPHHYELLGPLPALSIPATLQDSLMARLDRLVTARGIAQLGAVIGRQFSYALIQAVSQLDDDTLQREMARLIDAELLYQRGELPQATYIFKHALIQEVAYQSLLKSTRQQVHQRIVQVLMEAFPKTVKVQPELLAHHATEAGLTDQAVGYWQQAGQHALRRSANIEAAAHFRQGLTLLKTLPETPEHLRQELNLQAALAPALIATQGFAAPDVVNTYFRARELCQQVGTAAQLFPVLRGLWVCLEVRADLQTARTLGEQLLEHAQRDPDPAHLVEAHRALGNTFFWLGELDTARDHLERGIALYDAKQHHALAFLYGTDPGVICCAYAAWVYWLLGFPEQALASSQKALGIARTLAHAHSEAAALNWAGVLHHLRREEQAAYEQSEALMTLAKAQGFPYWLAEGRILRSWALAALGQTGEAIEQIHQGLAAYRATGAEIQRPYWLALEAEAYALAGQHAEALQAVNDGIRAVYATGEHWYHAELYRLKGELLLAQSESAPDEVDASFQEALTTAQQQQAKSLELRTAMSLSRMWLAQGEAARARALLAPVYQGFTEGFDTADLWDAKTLLASLEAAIRLG
ncbi:adenylate/guanylate cyclase domain-containing protein [Candidatus Entotheonella palauensis]|nr:adenylate/guanylate cyclase domain-containing protein [Candidatus Entotheonella palauensis]